MNIKLLYILIFTVILGRNNTEPLYFSSHNENFKYSGRFEFLENDVALISPGASVSINFSGNYCKVNLRAENQPYNYVAFELDGKYLGRIKIESQSIKEYTIKISSEKKSHNLKIIKETEASNGSIIFNGIDVQAVLKKPSETDFYIEFIGDSITCGAAADGSITPCNTGNYFDQENVYFAYGPVLARTLNSDFTLSAVSGIGMYRNWNDENIEEPTMPQVYENLYLNTDTSLKNKFKHEPHIVSICLGTNDLSNGDGEKQRLPFNKEKYVSNYINFIKMVYSHYPNTQIVLLNSPTIVGETNTLLVLCLKEIQNYFAKDNNRPILLFEFNESYTNGCSYHPSVKEHKQIAEKLTPFFRDILNEKF